MEYMDIIYVIKVKMQQYAGRDLPRSPRFLGFIGSHESKGGSDAGSSSELHCHQLLIS